MKPLTLGYDAMKRPIRLQPDDRKTHMHVIGSSGSGKSKFLEWMIRGDLHNRQGFALLDPHGTLYDAVVKYCARYPLRVPRDIILLNLSAPQSIVGFNPFQRAPGADVAVQVDARVQATLHAWNALNTDQTPSLARNLRIIYTVMLVKNLGLPQVPHLMDSNSREIRGDLIKDLGIPLIEREWQELHQLKAKDFRAELLSAKNRLFKFLTSTTLAQFMGLPGRSIDLADAIENNKVVLVRLAPTPDKLSDDSARTFGALLLNEFFEVARRREPDALGADPHPYYVYMDEFQEFVSPDISKMLDQVRKFGLFTILSHQRFGQLTPDLIDSLGNCHIKAVFGGLPVPWARYMAEEMFIGKIDPKRVKVAIYQTKFWPTEETRQVHTHSTSHTSSAGWNETSATGSSYSSSTGEFFGPDQWFGSTSPLGRSSTSSAGNSDSSGSGSSGSDSYGESDSVADIPVFVPVPFQELSSVQYYSTEEQLIEFAAALKNQFKRHCFIKIQEEDAEPMLVPNVGPAYITPTNISKYEERLGQKAHALPAVEVDRLLAEQEKRLLSAGGSADAEPLPSEEPPEPPDEDTAPSVTEPACPPEPKQQQAGKGAAAPEPPQEPPKTPRPPHNFLDDLKL